MATTKKTTTKKVTTKKAKKVEEPKHIGLVRDDSWLEIVKAYTGADDATMAAYFPER